MKFVLTLLSIVAFVSANRVDAQHIAADGLGNVYLLAMIGDSLEFQDGSVIHNPTGELQPSTCLMKTDPNGNVLWYKIFDHALDDFMNIKMDYANNILLVAGLHGTAVLDSTTITAYGFYIAKLDTNGNLQWARTANTSGYVSSYVFDIAVDAVNNVYAAAVFTGVLHFDGDDTVQTNDPRVFVAKFDDDGNNVWLKKIGGDCEWLYDIDSDSRGNVAIVGKYRDSISYQTSSFDGDFSDGYVLRVDSNGALINLNVLRSSGSAAVNNVAVGRHGRYSYDGYYNADSLYFDAQYMGAQMDGGVFLLNMEAPNSLDWFVNVDAETGGPGISSNLYDLHADQSNNLYYNSKANHSFISDGIAGSMFLGRHLLKFDSAGNVLCTVNTSSPIMDFDVDANQNIYAIGHFLDTLFFNGVGYQKIDDNLFVFKLDSNCNTVWSSLIANTSLGISRVASSAIDLFPNPTTGVVILRGIAVCNKARYELFTADGRKVLESRIDNSVPRIDLSSLANGVYTLVITAEATNRWHAKIVKLD